MNTVLRVAAGVLVLAIMCGCGEPESRDKTGAAKDQESAVPTVQKTEKQAAPAVATPKGRVKTAEPEAPPEGADKGLAGFWRRGRVRELLVSGLPKKPADLVGWAAGGVNCVLGVKPEIAHAHGLKCRTWFTLNSISPRKFGNDLELIKKMAAINKDGSFRRPYDPLFPSVANNWSACVNNPLWRDHAAGEFRKMAENDYDGCHIDYASRDEPCFCEYCGKRWAQYALDHNLEETDIRRLPNSMRYRMHMREFRIQSVMDFLGMCREEARSIKPGFGTDGTWHQDSGSTYQWAYGDHFDMMCIEGTTWGPFPPESQQILWLKTAHALSKAKVAMSVTYHLITEEGKRHHGRTAADRTRLALCEIMSQGGVSWLGLGGPHTGSLLREHQDMVKDVYKIWAELEPQLTTQRALGSVGIVFSPRSFLTSGSSRKQLYAVGQALMKGHIPFVVRSDVGLTYEKLNTCPATVLLDAAALTPEATDALKAYVRGSGRLLVAGSTPKYALDWTELEVVPEILRKPRVEKGLVSKTVEGRTVWYLCGGAMAGVRLGAAQYVTVNQPKPAPLAVEGESKALNVSGSPDSNYSIYVDITYQDGSHLWRRVATFATGTHDWAFSRCIIKPDKPVRTANVHLLLRGHAGTVWFRKVRFGPWDPANKEITTSLLGDGLNPTGQKVYVAGPAQKASAGVWGPYANGFEVEEIAGEGPTVKLATGADVVRIPQMHVPDVKALQTMMNLIQPVLPKERMLSVDGEGARCVYCDVCEFDGGVLLQFMNYNAELHPELPEMEQQKAEKTIPVRNLRVTFTPPGDRRISRLTLKVPGKADAELPATGNTFVLPILKQYAAVIVELD